ncbi:MAG: sigma-70 family RNA polymerase sigma factor [Prevotella sp.]
MNITIEAGSLFTKHAKKMTLVAQLMLGDRTEAEDAVGDVFADVASGKISAVGDKTEALLMTCLKNRCLNLIKRRMLMQRAKLLATADDTVSESSPADNETDEMENILDFIDNELTPQTARILRMHYQQKLKYREIAAQLGISQTAVYKHLAQGINKLKRKFKNNGQD